MAAYSRSSFPPKEEIVFLGAFPPLPPREKWKSLKKIEKRKRMLIALWLLKKYSDRFQSDTPPRDPRKPYHDLLSTSRFTKEAITLYRF